MEAIIVAVIGLVTGAIGSFVAPWANWQVEKNRKRYDRRVELVRQWRELVFSDSFSRENLTKHPSYGSLRDCLSEEAREEIENLREPRRVTSTLGVTPLLEPYQKQLLEEISRIEKDWGLV